MQPKIIVCGLGRTGYKIFRLLQNQGAEVIGISDRPSRQRAAGIIVGDPRQGQLLVRAGIHTAQTLVLASNDDALNLAVLTQARVLNPKIRIVNRIYNQALGDRLDQTLPDHVTMSVSALAAPFLPLPPWAIKPSANCVSTKKPGPFTKK